MTNTVLNVQLQTYAETQRKRRVTEHHHVFVRELTTAVTCIVVTGCCAILWLELLLK